MAIAKSLLDFRRSRYFNDASLEDNHDTGGKEEVPPNVSGERRAKCYNQDKGKGKQREFTLRLRCFICDGPHLARVCPKSEALNALIKKSKKK